MFQLSDFFEEIGLEPQVRPGNTDTDQSSVHQKLAKREEIYEKCLCD